MKKISLIIVCLLMSLALISCENKGIGNGSSDGPQNNGAPSDEGNSVGGLGDNNIVIPEGHKVIYTVDYTLRIENEIALTIKTINAEVYALNGYVSTSKESLTQATYVYKIPVEKLNDFLDKVDAQEGVSSKNISSQDVTTSYNELQAEIEILTATKTAYENMLKENKLTLNEIMSLNDKIAQIESRLKTISKNLDSLSAQVNYSTVTVNYYLKQAVVKEKFLGNYGTYLLNICKSVVEFLAYSAPYLLVIGIGCGGVFTFRKLKKTKKD